MTSIARSTVTLLAFGALLMLPVMVAAQAQPLAITYGPSIEHVGPNSAEIAWTTSTGGSTIVHYGTDPNNLNQTAEQPYAQAQGGGQQVTHRVVIKNLQPNTAYYFAVDSGQGQDTGTEAKSSVQSFTTRSEGGGQTGQGALSGTVKDPSGNAVAGASVKVSGPASNTVTSDSQGVWRIEPLPSGNYTITVSAPGFKPQTQTIAVDMNSPAHVNLWLWPSK